jgi:hypothetical protein
MRQTRLQQLFKASKPSYQISLPEKRSADEPERLKPPAPTKCAKAGKSTAAIAALKAKMASLKPILPATPKPIGASSHKIVNKILAGPSAREKYADLISTALPLPPKYEQIAKLQAAIDEVLNFYR